MNDEALIQQAAQIGIGRTHGLSSSALARQVQVRLGERPCCGTDERYACEQGDCRWRLFCFRLVAAWQR